MKKSLDGLVSSYGERKSRGDETLSRASLLTFASLPWIYLGIQWTNCKYLKIGFPWATVSVEWLRAPLCSSPDLLSQEFYMTSFPWSFFPESLHPTFLFLYGCYRLIDSDFSSSQFYFFLNLCIKCFCFSWIGNYVQPVYSNFIIYMQKKSLHFI